MEGFLGFSKDIEFCLFPLGELSYGFKEGQVMNGIIYKNNYCGRSCTEMTYRPETGFFLAEKIIFLGSCDVM